MAFLDFIKNRNATQQQPVANKSRAQEPETAKEMYTRQEGQDRAAAKPITPEIKAQADRALGTITKASEHAQPPSSPAVPENAGSPAAQLQKQHGQDKQQNALSPTDAAAGKTAVQDKQQTPEKPTSRAPQTVPRRPPSWER